MAWKTFFHGVENRRSRAGTRRGRAHWAALALMILSGVLQGAAALGAGIERLANWSEYMP